MPKEAKERCRCGKPIDHGRAEDSLQAAIAYLGAVEVAPGRYACQTRNHAQNGSGYYSYGEPHWVVGDGAAMYALHAQGGSVRLVRMPAWWTPERRFVWRDNDRLITHEQMRSEPAIVRAYSKRITADLETGEETPSWLQRIGEWIAGKGEDGPQVLP